MRNLYKSVLVATTILASTMSTTPVLADELPNTFVPISPCRIFDTRHATSLGNGRFIVGTEAETQNFYIYGGGEDIQNQGGSANCDIPQNATAVHLNLIATSPSPGSSFMRAWRFGDDAPDASVLVWKDAQASNSIALVFNNTGAEADITIKVFNNNTDVIGDALGYYIPKP